MLSVREASPWIGFSYGRAPAVRACTAWKYAFRERSAENIALQQDKLVEWNEETEESVTCKHCSWRVAGNKPRFSLNRGTAHHYVGTAAEERAVVTAERLGASPLSCPEAPRWRSS